MFFPEILEIRTKHIQPKIISHNQKSPPKRWGFLILDISKRLAEERTSDQSGHGLQNHTDSQHYRRAIDTVKYRRFGTLSRLIIATSNHPSDTTVDDKYNRYHQTDNDQKLRNLCNTILYLAKCHRRTRNWQAWVW